jgi:hypothetical protein
MLAPPTFNVFHDAGTLVVICAVNDGRAAPRIVIWKRSQSAPQ